MKPSHPTSELVLDVRPLFERGESPCSVIDQAVARLGDNQVFVLLAPFEPKPLFAKLAREGFIHHSQRVDDQTWRIEFRRKSDRSGKIPKPKESQRGDGCGCSRHPSENKVVELDTRGQEPPQPLVQTLEAVATLKKGQTLRMHSDRQPLHLLEQLEERGFGYDCTEQLDHSYLTEIWISSHECSNDPIRPKD